MSLYQFTVSVNIKTKTSFLLLFFSVICSNVFSQEISKEEERLRYEKKISDSKRLENKNELKNKYILKLNSNASQSAFDIAVKDLNNSKKFVSVKSEFINKRIDLVCKKAMLPEDLKELLKNSGLSISSYSAEDYEL